MLSWVSKLSSAAAGSAAVPSSGKRNCKTGAAPALLVNISLAGQISGGERGAAANVRPVDPRQREIRDSDRSETKSFNK